MVAAPASRLSFDVLALIVLEVAMDGDADAQDLRTLSSISWVWRDVTIHTPQAWSTIVLNFEPPNDGNELGMLLPSRRFLRTVRDVREWFESSGSCAIRCLKKIVTNSASFCTLVALSCASFMFAALS
ncbi:hypothetical protein EXIGLDRAFT_784247 [Exidia glandulosa HHB12029]|uniref:F-box domain-containing protein n=1 Tax=Exidia glandulosa HHB12029 TaxID=1314781 RepID=A0A166MKU6_EXIGL|nr:hypothetical protein EXIGLDRAFT_784247 [Exidia glandulosa HHB12029]